eukprot:768187-Hanusia_phi.AAC.1
MERLAIRDGCYARCKIVKDNIAFSSAYCSSAMYGNSVSTGTSRMAYFDMTPTDMKNCSEIRQLSTRTIDQMWFDVISQYSNIGNFMIVVSLIAMVLSVVTTNDSGSIILNYIGSNGMSGASVVQKQLYSLWIGLVTMIMLLVGGNKALTALQTVIVVLGLPYTVIVCVMCYALHMAMEMELHEDTDQSLTVIQGRYNKLQEKDNGMEFWSHSILSITSVIDFLF